VHKLKKHELISINGGAVAAGWIVAGIVAGVSFIIGVIDGYVRPFKCRK